MTHLAVAAITGFLLSFTVTDVSETTEMIVISVHPDDCSETTGASKHVPTRIPLTDTAMEKKPEIICGSVSLDGEDQPRCNLELIA